MIVAFVLEKDADIAAQEVRDKVAAIARDLPKDADPPVIEKLSTDASPVINVVVASKRDLRETTKIVDDRIKKNIESLNGVGQVRFVGERTRQIQVWLDGEKLYAYGLNVDQVRNAIASQNVEIPGGRVDQGRRELDLRTLGRVERPQDFNRLIVATVGASPVRLGDIAHGGGRRGGAAIAGAPGRDAGRGAGGAEAVRHQHARRDSRREGAHRRARQNAAARFQNHLHARSIRRSSRSPSRPCRST